MIAVRNNPHGELMEFFFRFFNLKLDGKMATVLLENPVGSPAFSSANDLQAKLGSAFGTAEKLSSAEDKVQPISFKSLDDLHGKTLYLV